MSSILKYICYAHGGSIAHANAIRIKKSKGTFAILNKEVSMIEKRDIAQMGLATIESTTVMCEQKIMLEIDKNLI